MQFIKTTLAILIVFYAQLVHAVPISDALIATARLKGQAVYYTCITAPPIEPSQISICTGLYTKYVATLQAINTPFPLAPTTTPSPYASSPYDICHFDLSHFIFNTPGQPYCPTL